MRVEAAERRDFRWLVERTQCAPTEGFRALKAVDARGQIRGMVGYDAWTENACQAHMAVDTPIVWRSLLPAVFEYPFIQCNRGVLLGVIQQSNAKSWGMAGALGFRLTHRIRDGWAKGDDLLMLELRREDCRYLRRN